MFIAVVNTHIWGGTLPSFNDGLVWSVLFVVLYLVVMMVCAVTIVIGDQLLLYLFVEKTCSSC